jgi:DNA-binding IclR family transcriptional regulator
MLVYRDFAEKDADRHYRAGAVLRPTPATEAPVSLLRRIALPHMHSLVSKVGETTNLMVLVGREVRFIATVECDQALRAGDRAGRVLPAHAVSGGKALLAAMDRDELSSLFADSDIDLARLRRELALVRKRGFAINDQVTEAGLTAIGMALPGSNGDAIAAVSLAIPSARFGRDLLPGWVAAMSAAIATTSDDLDRHSMDI